MAIGVMELGPAFRHVNEDCVSCRAVGGDEAELDDLCVTGRRLMRAGMTSWDRVVGAMSETELAEFRRILRIVVDDIDRGAREQQHRRRHRGEQP